MNKVYGYARVSTTEQNLDRQLTALKEYVQDERDIICDKLSGKDFQRAGYISLRDTLLREGDTLVVKELDRLGRNMSAIKEEWEGLVKRGINIVVVDTPMLNTRDKDSLEKTLISGIVFQLLSYLAEKEREKLRSRQAEGLIEARKKGIHLGRPIEFTVDSRFRAAYNEWKEGKRTAVATMKMLGMKRTTFYRFVQIIEGR